jgi:hypothetical protein
MKPTSKFATDRTRRELASIEPKPTSKPRVEPRKDRPDKPPGKPTKPRMTEVTVKLTDELIAKLDRLAKRESRGLNKAGRSTVLRWILDRFEE